MQALASECTVVGSATSPVQEVIDDGKHGLLADFYDVDGLAERALRAMNAARNFLLHVRTELHYLDQRAADTLHAALAVRDRSL